MYWLFLVTLLVAPACSLPANITKFSQVPSGIMAPDTMVTYNCQAIGTDVTWFIDGVRRDETYSDYTISSEPIGGFEHWNITLTTSASRDKNNTQIQCYATGRISGQVDRKIWNITVAGPPLAPSVIVKVMDEGTVLNISWERPYSPEEFLVVSYNLTLHNMTSNTSYLLLQADTETYFLVNRTDYSDMCSMLNFTVTADSRVGTSDEGFAAGGFPLFPQTDGLVMQTNFTLVDGNPAILVEFQTCTLEVCEYQDPANYTLDIVDESGQVVDSTGPKEACRDAVEIFTTGIDLSQNYAARLVITQRHFTRQVLAVTDIRKYVISSTDGTHTSDSNHDLLIISMVSLGVALSVCVVLVITIAIACGYKRGRRPIISEHIEIPLQPFNGISEFKLAPPPKGKASKVPTSLPPMAVNPIYDGPMYDSPGGESFKLLLGSSSTPIDPAPSTPMGESCRYFDMPPSLPPPRKPSVNMRPHPLSPAIPEEQSDMKKEEHAEVKPLPFLAHPHDVPPAVYETIGEEHASTCK